MSRQRTAGLAGRTAAVLVLVALAACKVKSEGQLGPKLSVQGVVTDAATGELLPGVRVTLQSFDGLPSQLTNANGVYRFTDVQQLDGLVLQFQRTGYGTVNVTLGAAGDGGPSITLPDGTVINLGAGICAVVGTGTCSITTPSGARPDAMAVDVTMAQQRLTPYAGWVYAAGAPAARAVVQLVKAGVLGYQAVADATGHFLIPSVALGDYEVVVPPYDQDGDGVSDYQFYSAALSLVSANTSNLTNQVIRLKNLSHDVEAGTFLLTGTLQYPFSAADLLADDAVGWIQTTDSVFLHFGGEVDPALTDFELYAWDAAGTSAIVPATVTWDRTGVIATIRPATPFLPYVTDGVGYELRITSLFFKDGTIGIERTAATAGSIRFTAKALPVLLQSPVPSVSVAGELVRFADVNPIPAADVAFDANVAWLLAPNGDFVEDPALNWDGTVKLTWRHVAGADHYRVWARNTAVLDKKDWTLVGAVARDRFDPNLNVTVATVVDLGGLGLGYPEGLRALGNGLDVAVTAVDAWGFESRVDPARALHTEDTFAPFLTAADPDAGVGPVGPFGLTTELGSVLRRVFSLGFSEPIRGSAPPVLTPLTDNLRVVRTEAVGWGRTPPTTVPQNSTTQAQLATVLQTRGSCVQLEAARSAGDTWLPVNDSSSFTAGDRALVVSGGLSEEVTVGSVLAGNDPALLVPAGLQGGVAIPAVVCRLAGPDVTAATAFPTLRVSPEAIDLYAGTGAFQFQAVGGYTPVTWVPSAGTVGTLAADGTYTPPATLAAPASFGVYARSGSLWSSSSVTVQPENVAALALNPLAVRIRSGTNMLFTALQNVAPPAPAVTFTTDAPAGTLLAGPTATSVVFSAPAVAVPTTYTLTVNDGALTVNAAVVVLPPASTATSLVRVADAALFHQGQSVLLYRPALGGLPAIFEVFGVLSVNTATGALLLDGPVNVLHDTSTLVLPFPSLAGEQSLRAATYRGVALDAAVSAGPVELTLDGGLERVMVGDRLLVDTDGDLRTTGDQAIVRITALRAVTPGFPFPSEWVITVDRLPVVLRTGQSRVAGLGDSFTVSGYSDTATPAHPANTRQTRFTADGLTF